MAKKVGIADIRGDNPTLRALNPHVFGQTAGSTAGKEASLPVSGPKTAKTLPKVKKMTKPERCMDAILAVDKHLGVLTSFHFEGITLKLGDDCRYTPDFAAFRKDGKLVCYECKGPFIREDAMVKFKTAKTIFPEIEFEMWQLSKTGDFDRIL